ncbi:hypothetical protein CAC42_2874 [Sphaceloma murrayae]|uniref:AB hydrolase-1 domain-containing protein n=1 Tax=Sphaceloma murrayae TaxID=2082308 RepID=A0A2K1R191_9PEZI|nr:hypothetical protein CAC42_2874 [Sphaceloma murrayae]
MGSPVNISLLEEATLLTITSGTGRTIPLNCNVNETDLYPAAQLSLVDTLFADGWTKVQAYSRACFDAQSSTGPYISTEHTARDMLRITQALGDGKTNYFGTSYGTQLGQTFASLFPNKVGRFLLDAVVNPLDYVAGPKYTWLADTDKVYDSFFLECASFPLQLPAPHPPGHHHLLASPQHHRPFPPRPRPPLHPRQPPPLPPHHLLPPFVYRTIKESLIRGTLYNPTLWPRLATALTSFLNGTDQTGTSPPPLAQPRFFPQVTPTPSTPSPASPAPTAPSWRITSPDALLPPSVRAQQRTSFFSNTFYDIATWPCAAWEIQIATAVSGPLLLLLLLPPSAFNASALFEGSRVLVHERFGHGLFADPSRCVRERVRAYFVEGRLPEEGDRCRADRRPFEGGGEARWI